jgi:hypothetical protein
LFSEKYEGINSRDYDKDFERKYSLDLDKIFECESKKDVHIIQNK